MRDAPIVEQQRRQRRAHGGRIGARRSVHRQSAHSCSGGTSRRTGSPRSAAAGRRGSRRWCATRAAPHPEAERRRPRLRHLALAAVADALPLAVVLAPARRPRPGPAQAARRRLDAVLAEHAVARAAAVLGRRRRERRRAPAAAAAFWRPACAVHPCGVQPTPTNANHRGTQASASHPCSYNIHYRFASSPVGGTCTRAALVCECPPRRRCAPPIPRSRVAAAAAACGSPGRGGSAGSGGSGGAGSAAAGQGGASGGAARRRRERRRGAGGAQRRQRSATAGTGGGGSGAAGSGGAQARAAAGARRRGSGGAAAARAAARGAAPAVVIPGIGQLHAARRARTPPTRGRLRQCSRPTSSPPTAPADSCASRRPNSAGAEVNSTVSEGIAYGMLLAVYADDQTTFDELWQYSARPISTATA